MLSLRARVVLGALFWTVGLLIMGTAVLITAIERYGDFRSFLAVHDVFRRPLVLLFAVFSMVAGVFQVRRGLAGIAQLRVRLGAVHDGRDVRVEGRYVPEVQPLVDDLNALLDHREHAVRRAVAKAGDLAHGLKTPLAVLAREAERAELAGEAELAAAITQQVERNAPADRLPPGACARGGVWRDPRREILDQGIGGWPCSYAAAPSCGPQPLHRCPGVLVAPRARAARGPGRDAGQPF